MLHARGIDLHVFEQQISGGQPVAMTPERRQAPVSAARASPGEESGGMTQQFQMNGQSTPQHDEIQRLNRKLQDAELELASRRLHSEVGSPQLAQVLERQTDLIEHVLRKPKTSGSTIKVEPRVH